VPAWDRWILLDKPGQFRGSSSVCSLVNDGRQQAADPADQQTLEVQSEAVGSLHFAWVKRAADCWLPARAGSRPAEGFRQFAA
jgi:hypothetical protein